VNKNWQDLFHRYYLQDNLINSGAGAGIESKCLHMSAIKYVYDLIC